MRLLLVAVMLVSGMSFAQNSSGTQKKPPTSKIDFLEDDVIKGDFLSPAGEVIEGNLRVSFKSLIRVRENFADKLKASVNELR